MKSGYSKAAVCAAIALASSILGAAQAAGGKHTGAVQCPVPGSAVPRATATKTGDEKPIAVVEGQAIYARDISGSAAAQLLQARQQEYKIESQALEDLIGRKVIEAEAKKQGLTVEQLYQKEVDAKIPEPSDDETRGYYLAVKDQTTLPFDQIKDQVKRLLQNKEIQEARKKYAESLRTSADVAIYLQPPAVDLGQIDPARVEGNADAPITIVEFADFQCPFCSRAEPTLSAILKKYNGKVKLAFRDFPLTAIHPYAEGAAMAGRCAEAQGKFWPMHDAMYADQSKLSEADLVKTAASLGMNQTTFSSCLKSGNYGAAIRQDVADGTSVGLNGTPAFFINGQFLSGSVPQAQFDQIIDSELAALKNGSKTKTASR
jgi:protein-disulfide isomerase